MKPMRFSLISARRGSLLSLGGRTEPEAHPLAAALNVSLSRNNCDASVSDVNSHALSRGESRVLQPVATQAEIGNFGWSRPAAIQLIFVAAAGDTQQAGFVRDGSVSSHDGLLVDCSSGLLFREAAGYLNTATRRPAVFPFQVLYSCALPDHSRKRQAQKKRRLSDTVSR